MKIPPFARLYAAHFTAYAERAAPLLLAFLEPRAPRRRLLDLGCGPGTLARAFARAGWEVTALDRDEGMLAAARAADPSAGVRWVRGDLRNPPVPGPFGAVVSTYNTLNQLESEEDLERTFREAFRRTGPGGWFLFDLHTARGLAAWTGEEHLEEEPFRVRLCWEHREGEGRLRLEGRLRNAEGEEESFTAEVANRLFALPRVRALAEGGGWEFARFARVDALEEEREDPEAERRVFVVLQKPKSAPEGGRNHRVER